MATVNPVDADWNEDFQEWLEPFLAVFKRSEQRCWAPRYLQGLIGPGARKSGRTRVSRADAATPPLCVDLALVHRSFGTGAA
jgi:hypothetical protein